MSNVDDEIPGIRDGVRSTSFFKKLLKWVWSNLRGENEEKYTEEDKCPTCGSGYWGYGYYVCLKDIKDEMFAISFEIDPLSEE